MAQDPLASQTVPVTGVIDDYVSAVGSRLRGSARLRADMLAEIRDALTDAADDHRRHGIGTPEAQRLAVREFGPARLVAAGLQDVLAVVQARRTALLLFVVLVGQHGTTELVGRVGGWRQLWGDAQPGEGYLWLARATDVFGGLALTAALGAVVLLGYGAHRLEIRPVVVRLTAVLASAVVATTLLCGVLLTFLPPRAGGPGTLAGVLGGATASALVLGSAWRCWRTAARPDLPVPAQPVGP